MKTQILKIAALSLTFLSTTSMVSFNSSGERRLMALAEVNTAMAAESLNNIQFDFDKSEIKSESFGELDKVAKVIVDNKFGISLGGHADATGEYVYNWHLSKRRADAVKAYLISKGVDAERVSATEYGDTKPAATNDTEEGREKNRRVEMKLL